MENSPNNSSRFLDESGEHLTNDAITQFIHPRESFSEEDKLLIENHLADCPDCSKRYYEVLNAEPGDKEIEESINVSEDDDIILKEEPVDISGAPPPPAHKMAVSNPLLRNPKFWILATGLLVIIFIWFFFLSSDEAETNEVTDSENPEMMQDIEDDPIDMPEENLPPPSNENQQGENTPANQNEEEFTMPEGDSFAENPVYEEMIMYNSTLNNSISLNEPSMGETMGSPLHFHWQKPENIRYVQLIVITNEGKSVYNSTLGGNEITIDKKLAEGLYYVKLSAGSGNEALGKFYVR